MSTNIDNLKSNKCASASQVEITVREVRMAYIVCSVHQGRTVVLHIVTLFALELCLDLG